MPMLVQGLKSIQAQSLCIVSIGVVVDLCTAVGENMKPFCDDIMSALTDALRNVTVPREIKPVVISCFGDIAMAIGASYEPYLQMSVMMLMQAAQAPCPDGDDDLIDFVNSLRLAILEAYSGIIYGLSDGKALHLMVPNVPAILQFLQYLSAPESNRDDDVLQKAVALIGDLTKEMKDGNQVQVLGQLNQPFIAQLIDDCSKLDDQTALETANWTRSVLHGAGIR